MKKTEQRIDAQLSRTRQSSKKRDFRITLGGLGFVIDDLEFEYSDENFKKLRHLITITILLTVMIGVGGTAFLTVLCLFIK